MSAYYLAKQHKTALDCGSGLTTLVMAAAGCKVYALEHDWEWYSRVKQVAQALNLDAEVIYAPIKDYGDFVWYDHQNLPQPRAYGLIMIDGPPRTIGRFGVFRIFNMNNATVIMDDCEEPTLELAYHEQLKFDGLKPFIIARPECLKKSA